MIFYMDQIASQIIHAKSDMFIIRNTSYSSHYYDYLKLSRYQYENIQQIWDSKNRHPEIASWHYMQEKHLT